MQNLWEFQFGNLYYHYKNKEEIIKDIYLQMSSEFEDLNIFDNVMKSETPFTELSLMFDLIGELFWKYRFFMFIINIKIVVLENYF